MTTQAQIQAARSGLEELQSRYREMADSLTVAINALRELEETGEFASSRRDAIEAAKGLLTPEALKMLDLGGAVAAPKKKTGSPWFQRPEGG